MRFLLVLPVFLMGCDLFSSENDEWDEDFTEGWYGTVPDVSYESDALVSRGGLWVASKGMAPQGQSRRVWLGMGEMLCAANFRTGMINADLDVENGEETITDWNDDAVIGVTPDGVFEVDPETYEVDNTPIPGAVHALDSDDGVVVVVDEGDCVVGREGDKPFFNNVPSEACEVPGAVSVDKPTGNTFVATPDGVVITGPDGQSGHPAQGDLVAVDASSGVLYVAQAAAGQVDAWTQAGVEVWSHTLGAPVTHLRVAKRRPGAIAVTVESGRSSVWFMSVQGEAPVRLLVIDGLIDDLAVSDDGARFSLSLGETVSFFGYGEE